MGKKRVMKKEGSGRGEFPASQGKVKRGLPFVLTFMLTFCLWIFFSGRFDLFHLGLGGVSCLMVSVPGSRLIFPQGFGMLSAQTGVRFLTYLPWLFFQIFLANLHLLYLTFHPRLGKLINPKIIRFDTCLKSDMARTTFANSITLTPGTITVYAGVMGRFAVHCIDDQSGQALPGLMEKKILKVFNE